MIVVCLLFQWKWPAVVFLVYRLIAAGYTLGWLIYLLARPEADVGRSLAFLTAWSYILLTLYLWVALCDLCYWIYKLRKSGVLGSITQVMGHQDWHEARAIEIATISSVAPSRDHAHAKESVYTYTWYHGLSWMLHDMVGVMAPAVTLIYFAAMYSSDSDISLALDINIHAVNTAIVLLDNCISAFPVRLLHVVYGIVFGLLYVLWSGVYYLMDPEDNVLYEDVLDWSAPEITVPVLLGVGLILAPLLQLLWYGLYRLRLRLFKAVYGFRYCEPALM